ncbi:MAG: sigma-70 family RNA polymerase sigma factor [Woeseia sp.]|nr:sigma-70 family RNA polymerase sigma factor [Woeseia sp.]MBT8097994.1 sigma-70 family RNA polymerase sigma factor [Woeseia sp.]NNE61989.1 sigma-70 family RNA polymerase sigma factor [Woeseia sp.]NNL55129.1 sigma-70 family RNA polymerase sigma factor [Woeseia sp.]
MEVLLTAYEKPVFNAAFRMLGNADDAADATQNVFLKAFENIKTFDPGRRFFSWIYRIAINESIDQLKRRDRMTRVDQEIPDTTPAPLQRAVASQVDQQIQTALLSLSSEYRAVIVLHYFCDCDYRQISDTLDIPEKTVKSRLYGARQQLKAQLSRHGILSS